MDKKLLFVADDANLLKSSQRQLGKHIQARNRRGRT